MPQTRRSGPCRTIPSTRCGHPPPRPRNRHRGRRSRRTLLGDFGASDQGQLRVRATSMRTIGPFADTTPLWWAVEGRNKKSITLDLRQGRAARRFHAPGAGRPMSWWRTSSPGRWRNGPRLEALAQINRTHPHPRVPVWEPAPTATVPAWIATARLRGLLYITGDPDRPPTCGPASSSPTTSPASSTPWRS